MLKASLSTFLDDKDQSFYLFNVDREDIRYSIPLNTSELIILESGLDGCLYQGLVNLQLEFCKFNMDKKNNYLTLSFITQVPMLSFKLQRSEAVKVLNEIKKTIDTLNL